jgi:hypothetical protein
LCFAPPPRHLAGRNLEAVRELEARLDYVRHGCPAPHYARHGGTARLRRRRTWIRGEEGSCFLTAGIQLQLPPPGPARSFPAAAEQGGRRWLLDLLALDGGAGHGAPRRLRSCAGHGASTAAREGVARRGGGRGGEERRGEAARGGPPAGRWRPATEASSPAGPPWAMAELEPPARGSEPAERGRGTPVPDGGRRRRSGGRGRRAGEGREGVGRNWKVAEEGGRCGGGWRRG